MGTLSESEYNKIVRDEMIADYNAKRLERYEKAKDNIEHCKRVFYDLEAQLDAANKALQAAQREKNAALLDYLINGLSLNALDIQFALMEESNSK